MALEFGSSLVGAVMAKLIDRATEEMSNLLQLGGDIDEIQNEQERLQIFIGDVHNLLNAHQYQNVPKSLEIWLHKMEATLQDAKNIARDYNRNDSCSNCLSRRKLSRRTLHWKRNTEKLLQQTAREIPLLLTVEQRLPSSAFRPVRLDRLVQPVPESGFVGTQIQRQESLLRNWLINDDRTRVMAVLGMGGVGKTSLLKKINNSEAVQKAFDHSVIWITVSQNRSINDLQNSMGRRIGIALSESSSEDERAMVLNSSLMNILRFLLILDDVWTRIELAKLGVCRWTGGYGWKVVLSTRIEQVTRSMRADRTIKMKPLCEEESWALFNTGAFGDGQPVSQEIERIAKEVADECQGLPLARNVISAAMAKQTDRSQWDVALKHLKTVDDTIYSIHQDIDRDLYKRLRLSYNALRDDLKLCFLYCAFYPEDKGIHVEELIKMWRAEGLVKSREPGNINEIGHAFLKVLIDRCLIEVECENSLTREVQYCRMHDVIRDMAIRIGDEEKCLLRAGQNVKTFPLEVMDGCERISLMSNNIESLPDNFVCPSLLSLVL